MPKTRVRGTNVKNTRIDSPQRAAKLFSCCVVLPGGFERQTNAYTLLGIQFDREYWSLGCLTWLGAPIPDRFNHRIVERREYLTFATTFLAVIKTKRALNLWFYFHNSFHLDRNVQWQRVGANGGSSMVANWFSKHFHHQVGTSIHHQVLFFEILCRLDNSKHLSKQIATTLRHYVP